jgi:hypothetical protein
MFCKHRGIEVESSLFELIFVEPQNFSKFRQIEVDGSQMGIFAQAVQVPFMSKRFAMKRYLGLTDAEILQNEKLFIEETGLEHPMGDDPSMIDVGVRPAELDSLGPDMSGIDDMESEMPMEPGAESPISGAENAPVGDMAPLTPPA